MRDKIISRTGDWRAYLTISPFKGYDMVVNGRRGRQSVALHFSSEDDFMAFANTVNRLSIMLYEDVSGTSAEDAEIEEDPEDNEPYIRDTNTEEDKKLLRLRLKRMKPGKVLLVNYLPCVYNGKHDDRFQFYVADLTYKKINGRGDAFEEYIGQDFFKRNAAGQYYFDLTEDQAINMIIPY